MKDRLAFFLLVVLTVALSGNIVSAQDCRVGGPYQVDEHTLLLLRFDGTFEGAQGETPTYLDGVEFVAGKFAQGAFFEGLDRLWYHALGNLELEEGTVEFWVKPNWGAGEPGHHILFEAGDCFHCDRMRIFGANTMVFQTYFYTGEYPALRYTDPNWVAGEWHHVGVTWKGTEIALYVDAVLVASKVNWGFLNGLPPRIEVGGACPWGDYWCPDEVYEPADGVMDEFRISNVRRCFGELAPPGPILGCSGFQPPMASGTVTARGNRALPLKAQLFDADGYEMTDMELTAPPVLQVMFQAAGSTGAVDVTDDALPAGFGTEGNEFEYNFADGVWQYNLKTKDHTAAGTYTITVVSGDASEYIIDPTCVAAFERQE